MLITAFPHNPAPPVAGAAAGTSVLYAPGPWPEPPSRPTTYPVLITAMALMLLPLIAASQIAAHLRMDVVDDQMFGYYGWRIAHGATVYKDVWDNKPPGIYWINALGFLTSGDSYGGVIALCALALVMTHAAFFIACASIYFREAAAIATILAGFFITHGYYQGGTNRTETFLIAFEVCAAAIYVRAFASDRWWKWFLAGALCGVAFLFKQVGLAAWGAMGIHLVLVTIAGDIKPLQGLKRALLLLVGAAFTVAIAAGVLAAQGALSDALFATFGFNRAYFAVGDSRFTENTSKYYMLKWHVFPILLAPVLMAIVTWIHSFLWWLRPWLRPVEIESKLSRIRPTCPRYVVFFTIWLFIAAYGAVLSPHAFRHYLVPVIPPLMLLCGYLINVLLAEISLLRRLQQRAWVTAVFVAIGYFASEAAFRQWQEVSAVWVARGERGEEAEWESIGKAVARVTKPGDKIQCWGYLPGVYLQARRENVCRFTTTEKLGQVGAQASFVNEELHRKLLADPPTVFVLSANDYNWLHGEGPVNRVVPVDPFGPWMDEKYERVDEVKNFYIMKLKSKPAPASS